MPLPPGITPRDYQYQQFHMIREAFRENMAVLAEAPTGSGKSVLMSLIVDSFMDLNRKWKVDRHLYFIVDELFLQDQFSGHLDKWRISHDLIGGGNREGRSVHVHVCTIQTLAKYPPHNEPALFVIDEAHFSAADRYMDLFYKYPNAKILGLTASPEQSSGKGLASDWKIDEEGNRYNDGPGIYDVMVECPTTMLELTEQGWLSKIRYFGIPIQGIENLHMLAGDYKNKEVEELLKERGTYGDAIKEMENFPEIKSHILCFCKSVPACYEIETVLHSAGYTAEVLEGSLGNKQRKSIMKNFASGKTQILVTCKMVLKGVDLPFLLMSVDLAPTPSRGTLRQKIGRGTRPAPGKTEFVYLDMVGNHRILPGGNVYSKIDWNFDSKRYNQKPDPTAADHTCPLCYALIPHGQTVCPECGAEKPKRVVPEKDEKHLDGELVEIQPVPLADRTGEDRAEVQISISKALQDNDLAALWEIGKTVTGTKKLKFWCYHKMKKNDQVVDVPLIFRMKRMKLISHGEAWFMQKHLNKLINIEKLEKQIKETESYLSEFMVKYDSWIAQNPNPYPDEKLSYEATMKIKEAEIQKLKREIQDWNENWKNKR